MDSLSFAPATQWPRIVTNNFRPAAPYDFSRLLSLYRFRTKLAIRDNDNRTDLKRLVDGKVIKVNDVVRVSIIFFCNRINCVSSPYGMAHAGYRENDKNLPRR